MAILVGFAGALLVLGIASGEPTRNEKYGGVLVVGLTRGAPGSLDPTILSNVSTVEVLRTICQRLYDFDARSRVVPELAARLPSISPDKLTYTIPLRHGIEFNDGTPLNAQAVVTTIERDINSVSARASDYSSIDAVTASGQYTVVLHLKTPFTPLLKTLASNDGDVMSPTALGNEGSNFGANPVCVGPFMFDHQTAGSSITVIKSPYYYDQAEVHLDKIVFQVENDASAAMAALQAGDLQMVDSIDPTELSAFANNPNFHLFKETSLGFEAVRFNIGNSQGIGNLPYTNVGTPWAKSAALRQAFEEAIDRNALVRVVYQGAALPGCTPVSPASPDYDPTIHCTPYAPAQARKLVAESGYVNPTLHLLVQNTTVLLRLAQFIQAEEAAVGINVIVDPTGPGITLSAEVTGSFPGGISTWSGSPDTDRNVYQWLDTNGTLNGGGYTNPRLDLILANTRKAESPTALKTLYHAAFEIILSDRPLIYLDHPIIYAAVSTNLKGIEFLSDAQARVSFAQYR